MGMCPVCNGMESLEIQCDQCRQEQIDYGRIMDYYEKYDAYLPIDLTKMNNGIENDLKEEKCPHYLQCSKCGRESVHLVQEQ
ncbi:hypothetical protein JCM9140_1888 [Halalkalibacter wakoensis JCM 9140]|uniref:Uncharacterized protein n=1 Tax=Halalkalibacter wakoensis JCM 9140 TaxID=1236970 RepID=W4Q1L8_9BACI|nr:hypothetical protein [Halalkalibacter wakoensis]GAE25867.1 hypothetical protein JCM9140_1888 [Halalkalibacter wakoensis JCM 9140]